MKSMLSLILFFLASITNIYGLDIYLAPFVYIEEPAPLVQNEDNRFHSEFMDRLQGLPLNNIVQFRLVSNVDFEAPQSLLEAIQMGTSLKAAYLLFGYIRKTRTMYFLELKLLDCEQKTIVQTFLAADSLENYQRLMFDAANKVWNYFYVVLGYGSGGPNIEQLRNIWDLKLHAGYWTPIDSAWTARISGICTGSVYARLIPVSPFRVLNGRQLDLGWGLGVEYDLAINKPVYERAYLHSVVVKLAPAFGLNLLPGLLLQTEAGISWRLDFLYLLPHYNNPSTLFSMTPGLYGQVSVEYFINSGFKLIAGIQADWAMYKNGLISIAPLLGAGWRFGGSHEE